MTAVLTVVLRGVMPQQRKWVGCAVRLCLLVGICAIMYLLTEICMIAEADNDRLRKHMGQALADPYDRTG